MGFLNTLYGWYGKMTVRIVLVIIIVLICVGVFFVLQTEDSGTVTETRLPTLLVAAADSQSGQSVIELIGTVKAVDQAEIKTETSGRVTQVQVALGDTVRAGAIVAQLENASQRAAVLQAEGVYEAAVAAAAQSDISVSEATNALKGAQDTAVTVVRNAFNTFRDILRNDVDDVFSDPDGSIPGLRLQGGKQTTALNSQRVSFQDVLAEWQGRVNQLSSSGTLSEELVYATAQTELLAAMLDSLLVLTNDPDSVGVFTKSELATLSSTFASDRATLNTSLSSIDSAITTLKNAQESLSRAQIGGTQTDISSANAQVKQALGSLRAAQANLEKTYLRTPIAGTVNAITVDAGDFVGSFEQVALIANNNALEITTFVGESDRATIAVGQSVQIEGAATGTITHIAPAVDPVTRKIEVKIAAEDATIANGDTVKIRLTNERSVTSESRLFVPITAVKFTETNGSVFTVENNTLVAHPVEIGEIRGSYIEIRSGIDPTEVIVLDARGRAAGQKVEAVTR